MRVPRLDDDAWWEPAPWGFGSAHSISGDCSELTAVERLHQVVEEVTGKPVEAPPKKIGFY